MNHSLQTIPLRKRLSRMKYPIIATGTITLMCFFSFAVWSAHLTIETIKNSGKPFPIPVQPQEGPPVSLKGPISPSIAIDEYCIQPFHYSNLQKNPWTQYSDKDAVEELKLCSYDFYGKNKAGKEYAVCPKFYSTFPGFDVYDVSSKLNPATHSPYTKAAYEHEFCGNITNPKQAYNGKVTVKHDAKKVAKFKQSISCSRSQSPLSYYHLSRLFGNILNIPVSVVRTMYTENHRSWVFDRGIPAAKTLPGLIQQTWMGWESIYNAPSSEKGSRIFIGPKYEQIYGVLSDNPRGEVKDSPLNVKKKDAHGIIDFFENKEVQKIFTESPIENQLVKENPQSVLNQLVHLRDISNMVLMDSIHAQNDRIGNIHSTQKWYYIENGVFVKKNYDSSKTDENKDISNKEGVIVNEMVLKDNDCGMRNPQEAYFLNYTPSDSGASVHTWSHMSPKTYFAFMNWVENLLPDPKFKEFYKKVALFQEEDWTLMVKQAKKISALLKTRCEEGKLYLDLDPEDYFMHNKITSQQCDQPTVPIHQ